MYARNHVHGTAFDWFATGITLFEFITGRRPFEASRLQRYHLLKPESEVDGMAVAPLPSSTTRQRSAPSLCGLLQSDDSCDDSLTVEDLRITAQVTPECQDFIEQLLKPNVSGMWLTVSLLRLPPCSSLLRDRLTKMTYAAARATRQQRELRSNFEPSLDAESSRRASPLSLGLRVQSAPTP